MMATMSSTSITKKSLKRYIFRPKAKSSAPKAFSGRLNEKSLSKNTKGFQSIKGTSLKLLVLGLKY
jgi:hypothetical protein